LGETIESVATQALPQSVSWEILVVDNHSSDETRQVVESLQRRYPDRIRYFFEPEQGISYARNAGIREARGEILAFIDDDETADPGWLQNLTANLHSGEWSGAGGRVLPPSTFIPPRWLLGKNKFASGPLASFDLGPEARQMEEPPFGANMAFRRFVFAELGGFRTDLGRVGNNLISNEDTELGRRMMAAGMRIRYEPSAITHHPVEEARVRKEYFLSWWFNKGRSDIREIGNQPKIFRFLGIPLQLFRAFAWQAARWMMAIEPSKRFGCKIEVWACAGQIVESCHLWRDAKRKETVPNADVGPAG